MEARNVDDDSGERTWKVRMRDGDVDRCSLGEFDEKEVFVGCQKVVRRFSDQHVIQQDRSKLA